MIVSKCIFLKLNGWSNLLFMLINVKFDLEYIIFCLIISFNFFVLLVMILMLLLSEKLVRVGLIYWFGILWIGLDLGSLFLVGYLILILGLV